MVRNGEDENRYRRKRRDRKISDRPVGEEELSLDDMNIDDMCISGEEVPELPKGILDGMEEQQKTIRQQSAARVDYAGQRAGEREASKEPERRRNGRSEVRKEVLIDFVVDGTFSFSKVFPRVYRVIEHIIGGFEQAKREYRGVDIRYGLTVFRGTAESCVFTGENEFTDSRQEFLSALRGVVFSGGSPDGRENLMSALDAALRSLNNEGGRYADRGLLLFSDSLPGDWDAEIDFLNDFQNGYLNRGLRFAVLYTYDDSFMPALKMVDHDGRPAENDKNFVSCNSLQELLVSTGMETAEKIQKIVDGLLNQVSV